MNKFPSFLDYVNYSLDQNERVNINKTLLDSAKEFVNDKTLSLARRK